MLIMYVMGSPIYCETSLAMFLTAADSLKVKYGDFKMRSPEELLDNPEVVKKLSDAVTLLREQNHPEAAALLAVMISDPRGPELWIHMEQLLNDGWS